jgi:hypothetical protein
MASTQLPAHGPHITGATGGSGTRVVARILRHGGMYIGVNLLPAEDQPKLGAYSDRWINRYLDRDQHPLTTAESQTMTEELMGLLHEHCASMTDRRQPWGWKEPRSIYLLPFFHGLFPKMKFLHVIRDGRDMAYSGNQNQLRKHGSALVSAGELQGETPLQSFKVWCRINQLAADYGERHMPGQYLRVRFEDVCDRPLQTIDQIYRFLGLRGPIEQIARQEVKPPESIGRWRSQDPQTLAQIHEIGAAALRRFGYEALAQAA